MDKKNNRQDFDEVFDDDYSRKHIDDYDDDYSESYRDDYKDDYNENYSDDYNENYGDEIYSKLADFLSVEIDGDINVNLISKQDDEDGAYGDNETDSPDDRAAQAKAKTKMELYDWVQCIVGAIIVGIFIFVFIGRTIGVDGISMMDTLHNNDRVIMSNLFYTPKNCDVIVFQSPTNDFSGTPLVKRVIATEGQTVDINFECGHVFVDKILQCEPYINEPTYFSGQFQGPVTVKEGHVFVMGDNRNHSSDSRDSRIREVDTRYILGKVLFIAIPGGDEHLPRDWGRFGFIRTTRNCPVGEHCTCYVKHETPLSECNCLDTILKPE